MMEIEIIDIKMERGILIIQAKYSEPIRTNIPWDIPLEEETELNAKNSEKYKQELSAYDTNIKKLHIGKADLTQKEK